MFDTDASRERFAIERQDLQAILDALLEEQYTLIGPTVRGAAIAYDEIKRIEDLPEGVTAEQDAGAYRLRGRDDDLLFGFAPGPDSWRRFFDPPRQRLWGASMDGTSVTFLAERTLPPKLALVGVRPCELHALRIQDEVHLPRAFADPHYRARRDSLFIIAVHCTEPGGTCFCASTGTGPGAPGGYDLALTELGAPPRHSFVVDVGSDAGRDILSHAPHRVASTAEAREASSRVAAAALKMGRQLDTSDLEELLSVNADHPRWDAVAKRCLACANCTMVCPTCFCVTIEDASDPSASRAERVRRWDSCFTLDFSHIHGGSVRASARSRYRQWMTHKLATSVDQFGSRACVGCGRCITWCPVGIDITEEAAAIRSASKAPAGYDAKEVRT